MSFFYFFYPKRRLKKCLIKYLQIAYEHSNDNYVVIKRILSIARRLNFTHSEVEEMNKKSQQHSNSILSIDKFEHLYEFIKFIFDWQEQSEEFDLCVEMAIILGFERHKAPSITKELFNGILAGCSMETLKEKLGPIISSSILDLKKPFIY